QGVDVAGERDPRGRRVHTRHDEGGERRARVAAAVAGAVTPHPLTSYALAVVGGTDGHYAKSGDLYIRYEVTGDGPIDLLALSNGSSVWADTHAAPHRSG